MVNVNYIGFSRFGEPLDVLELKSKQMRPPEEGKILVRMKTRPINPSDLIPIRGAYSHRIMLPNIPGYEGVGEVIEIGKGVPASLAGRRVLALRGEGTWQEVVTAEARWAVPVPDGIDDDSAAQLYINPVTAWLVLTQKLKLRQGDTIVVNAGGSAIGRIFAQLAKLFGYKLIAVTRNGKHTDSLLELGAAHVVNECATAEWREAVMDWTNGRGAQAGIDSIGEAASERLARSIVSGGTVLCIGLLSGVSPDWAGIAGRTGVVPAMFWLRHWVERATETQWHETFGRITQLVERGQLRLAQPGYHIELERYKDAIRLAAEPGGGLIGKIMLTN